MPSNIGYDPYQYSPQGAAAQSIEQWAADMASQYTIAFANGNTDAFPANAFANTFWATLGLQPLPQESWGATTRNANNVVNPGVYSGLLQFFTKLAQNPQAAQSAGITVPNLPSRGPVTDSQGRNDLFNAGQGDANRQNALDITNSNNQNNLDVANANNQSAAQRQAAADAAALERQNANNQFVSGENAKNRDFDAGQNALNRELQLAITNLQESGMDRRQAEELASRMSIAQLQDAGESARNALRIAADLEMNARNDATNRYGIDTSAATAREDIAARERIATGDRTSREGIASADRAENARQFDMNLAEDRRQFNSTALLTLFDRGIELMKNPVDWVAYQYYMETLSIPLGALEYSAMATAMGAVPPTGPSEIGPLTGGPGMVDGDFAAARQVGVTPAFVTVSQATAQYPGTPTVPQVQNLTFASTINQDNPEGMAQIDRRLAEQRSQTLPYLENAQTNPAIQKGVQDATAQSGPELGNRQSMGATAAVAEAQTQDQGATRAPLEKLIGELAKNLGQDPAQLWKLSGAGNMTPGYSKEAIANAPVMQALKTGADSMSQFRTAAPGAQSQQVTPFGSTTQSATTSGPGAMTGLRGGQDLNANLLINNSDTNKQLIQGAVQADAFPWEDFQRQAFKASPITDYAVGSFGRRR